MLSPVPPRSPSRPRNVGLAASDLAYRHSLPLPLYLMPSSRSVSHTTRKVTVSRKARGRRAEEREHKNPIRYFHRASLTFREPPTRDTREPSIPDLHVYTSPNTLLKHSPFHSTCHLLHGPPHCPSPLLSLHPSINSPPATHSISLLTSTSPIPHCISTPTPPFLHLSALPLFSFVSSTCLCLLSSTYLHHRFTTSHLINPNYHHHLHLHHRFSASELKDFPLLPCTS